MNQSKQWRMKIVGGNTEPQKVEGSHILENLKLFFTVDNFSKIYSAWNKPTIGYSCSLKTAVTACSEGTEPPLRARSADSLLQLAKNKDSDLAVLVFYLNQFKSKALISWSYWAAVLTEPIKDWDLHLGQHQWTLPGPHSLWLWAYQPSVCACSSSEIRAHTT